MCSDPSNFDLLLVEDDENDAFFFNRTLRLAGIPFRLEQVVNGAEAVDFLSSRASSNSLPKIMFLDLKMPVMSGFEVLSWMKTQRFPSPIEVIVLSGSDQPQDKDLARQLGAEEYLVKPVKVADFHNILEKMLPTDSSSTKDAKGHS